MNRGSRRPELTQVKVCRIDEIPPGEAKQFYLGENEILVINLSGRYFCLAARCTHAGAPLVEGEIIEDVLICPWHGSNFRVTDGSVLKGPAERPLRAYPSVIKGDNLFVEF
jgi:nitrite reductase/ring-hydroxylating ferredoxin subunit